MAADFITTEEWVKQKQKIVYFLKAKRKNLLFCFCNTLVEFWMFTQFFNIDSCRMVIMKKYLMMILCGDVHSKIWCHVSNSFLYFPFFFFFTLFLTTYSVTYFCFFFCYIFGYLFYYCYFFVTFSVTILCDMFYFCLLFSYSCVTYFSAPRMCM